MIEDEIIHWYKDDKGDSHRSALRVESEPSALVNGYPKDGLLTVRIANSIGTVGFRLNPDEALRFSTLISAAARELLLRKRVLWQQFQE